MIGREEVHMIQALRNDLEPHIDLDYRARVRDHYNMNVDRFLGVRIPLVRKIANTHFKQLANREINSVLVNCNQLLAAGIYEYKIIAFQWAHRCQRAFEPAHFTVLSGWLEQYVDDWSDCDDLCTHALGAFLLQYPEFMVQIQAWPASPNRWVRRAAAVALIPNLRQGKALDTAFEIADLLLGDPDDLVQKGCGWMLKEASKHHPDAVFRYVIAHRETMVRATLRYAIEKLPVAYRQEAMAI